MFVSEILGFRMLGSYSALICFMYSEFGHLLLQDLDSFHTSYGHGLWRGRFVK